MGDVFEDRHKTDDINVKFNPVQFYTLRSPATEIENGFLHIVPSSSFGTSSSIILTSDILLKWLKSFLMSFGQFDVMKTFSTLPALRLFNVRSVPSTSFLPSRCFLISATESCFISFAMNIISLLLKSFIVLYNHLLFYLWAGCLFLSLFLVLCHKPWHACSNWHSLVYHDILHN